MDKTEDRTICAKCGGYCCKKSGCDYFVSDFESMKIGYLESILDTGRVSIIASFIFDRLPNNKLISVPLLSLRARNINRGEIDLLSFKTTCASLEENGCHFSLEERPSGGSTLVPSSDGLCHSNVDRLKELEKWQPYQSVLRRIVKRRTGMTVDGKIREDVENLFYNVLNKNFDGVAKAELYDVLKNMIPMLMEVYPEEYKKARIRAHNNTPFVLKKTVFNNNNK